MGAFRRMGMSFQHPSRWIAHSIRRLDPLPPGKRNFGLSFAKILICSIVSILCLPIEFVFRCNSGPCSAIFG